MGGRDAHWYDVLDSVHVMDVVHTDDIDGSYVWDAYDVIVSQSGGFDYAHVPSTIPFVFGQSSAALHFGLATSVGSYTDVPTWEPLNDPWATAVPAAQDLSASNNSISYLSGDYLGAGVVAGGTTDNGRVSIAHRFVSSTARVFFGYRGTNGVNTFWDDLLLESASFAIANTAPGGTPAPPPPPAPWVEDYPAIVSAYPNIVATELLQVGPYRPFNHGTILLSAGGTVQVEGNHPKVWQVPYPEGFPNPGEELRDQTGMGDPL